jgi:hypothetical protein
MALGSWLIDHMVVNLWVVSGCSKRSLGQMLSDGTIDKYKARFVAKGYTQKEGEDFFDTYSPIDRLTIIHVLLSLWPQRGLLTTQPSTIAYIYA